MKAMNTYEDDMENNKGNIVHDGITYKKKEYLGKGGFAQCHKFQNLSSGEDVAIKVIDKKTLHKSRTLKKLLYEISIHKSLDHPNVVKFYDHFEDSKNVYIILELCEDGNLNDYFKSKKQLIEDEVRDYIRQLVCGLKYCHEHNIIHRDLKLGNLLLSKNRKLVKLGDFGLSSRLEYKEQRRRTICGTPNYIAPEIIGAKTTHSFEVDVWSLGIIIYILLIGSAPFASKVIKETYRKIKSMPFKIPHYIKLSEEARDLLKQMLEKDSSRRITIDELNDHPFVTKNGTLPGPLDQEAGVVRRREEAKLAETEDSPFTELAIVQDVSAGKIPKVWVVKCADYSAKYGMGYLLSNGHIGVFFNDKTKMLLGPKGNKLMYVSLDEEGLESTKKYNVKKLPATLDKKFRLLESFKGFLLKNYDDVVIEKGSFCTDVYVKSWLRTRQAFAFKFPHKVVQVLFNDNSEIRISGRPNKIVSYVSTDGTRNDFSLDAANDLTDHGLKKRIKYSKKIIKELVSR